MAQGTDGMKLTEHEIASAFARAAALSLLEQGFDSGDMTPEELKVHAAQLFLDQLLSDEPAFGGTTHVDAILSQARSFRQESEHDFALVFYAMWHEHTVNAILRNALHPKKLESEAEINQVVRLSLPTKLGAIWTLVLGEKIDRQLASGILRVAEYRNAFVHYKWPMRDINRMGAREADTRALIEIAESAVDALTTFRYWDSEVAQLLLGEERDAPYNRRRD